MQRIRRFEDLIAWQKGRKLVAGVYRFTNSGPSSRDFPYRNQIRSAALSVTCNIAEGFERGGRREFHQFLSTAKSSCGEVRSLIYNGLDIGYLEQDQFGVLLGEAVEVGRLLGGLRKAVGAQR